MKLFHAAGSRSSRVAWLLNEMGLECELVQASFLKPSPEFLEANPARTLPALVDGDVRMTESVAILQYLARKHGPTPLAVEPSDARYPDYLQFLYFGEASLAAPLNAVIGTRFLGPEDQRDNFTVSLIVRSFFSRLPLLERQLQRGPYMTGEDFTLADISVGYALALAQMLKLGDLPAPVAAYHERLSSRPAYQSAFEGKPPLG